MVAFCWNNLEDSLSFINAFIFAQALRSELYFADSLRLPEIEYKKYPIIANKTIIIFFSRNLVISNIVFGVGNPNN